MTRRKTETHDQTYSTPHEEYTGTDEDRISWPLSYPRNAPPFNFFSGNQSMLQEMVAVWNKLFKRDQTP